MLMWEIFHINSGNVCIDSFVWCTNQLLVGNLIDLAYTLISVLVISLISVWAKGYEFRQCSLCLSRTKVLKISSFGDTDFRPIPIRIPRGGNE